MGNVELEEDSNLVSVNILLITNIKQVSNGCIKITTSCGPAFFIRTSYLNNLSPDDIFEGNEFFDEKEEDIIEAGLCYVAESKAIYYLSRAEHSRFNLSRKLISKGFQKKHIEKALDYLESVNYLCDKRFAISWLNARKINHLEGRSRLLIELISRGINRKIAKESINTFFEENDEERICRKSFKKCKNRKMSDEKIVNYLIKHGFSIKLIKSIMNC